MRRLLVFLAALFVLNAVNCAVTESPDDDDDWEEPSGTTGTGTAANSGNGGEEADDDGRVYKNPRNSPSAQCPRDEEQATLLGQKCLRKCSSDEDCKSKKKKCLCDGACGMSCIKPDRECPELEKPEVGDVTVSGRLFGDKAVYSCPHGFHVVGLQSRNCQADGQWAGQPPACKQNIYCLTPPHIEHARHSALPEQATFDLDATIQYHCHTGYVTNGFPRAKCLAIEGQASWYGPDITCEPRSCGPPGELPHGWVTAECHTFGCRASLHCGAGFELVGRAERFCQPDGTWAPNELPTCVLVTAVQCPVPDAPRHGRPVYTSCAYNSIVSYECKYGYRLVGDNTRRCGADKKWSGTQPMCKEINCGHPGRLYNGWLENIEAGTGLGASIIFRCHDGMRMEGNSSTVCQVDGTWRYPLPKCLAPCVVPHVTQGKVILIPSNITAPETNDTSPSPTTQLIGSSTMVHHGEALIVDCEKNYEFLSNNPAVTCNNGTWTQIPKCQPARCKRLPKPPRNGMVVAPKTEHGMRARFHCKDGFELRGPDLLQCSFGNWTGEMPICQEVYCPFPGYIENGKVLLVGNMGLYDYRPYVRKVVNNKQIMYDCDKGYVLLEGPPGATCIGGHWSPRELPNCTLGQHPRLRWSRRRRSLDMDKFRHDRATYLRKYYDELWKKSMDIKRQLLIENYFKQLDELPEDATEEFNNIISEIRSKVTVQVPNRIKRFVPDPKNDLKEYHRIRLPPYNHYLMSKARFKRSRRSQLINMMRYNHYKYHRKRSIMSLKRLKRQAHLNDRYFELKRRMPFNKQYINLYRDIFNKPKTLKRISKRDVNSDLWKVDHSGEVIASVLAVKAKDFLSFPNRNQNERSIASALIEESTPFRSLPRILDDDFIKRSKRTSRKTEKLNQTTSTVPKNNKDAKGKQLHNNLPITDDVKKEENNLTVSGPTDLKNETIPEKGTKKVREKVPCEILSSEPYVNIEIVKYGKDPNISHSSGTIVRVACGKGYGLSSDNSTARCARGQWKPSKPTCEILPCHIPVTENGIFTLSGTDGGPIESDILLNDTSRVLNGQVVQFACEIGFNVQGASNLRCWHGEWAVTTMPECIPSPCELPVVRHGVYTAGYRAGLTIAHGSSVALHCEIGYSPTATFHCELGNLRPQYADLCIPIQGNYSNIREGQDFRGGSDIVREDFDELEYPTSSSNSDCGPPARVQGTLIYRDGTPMNSTGPGTRYPHGTEVTFRCIATIMGEKSTWKILCERGNWIGKSISCEEEDLVPSGLLGNSTCTFRNNEPNVVSFYNDLEIKEELVEFPAATVLISRCVDIGKYAMIGPNKRRCMGGEWDGSKPSCFGLNQENDYAMEKPPTILFRHQLGPIAQSNDGRLIVYPGTILHMECLWMRRFGNPKWTVSHEYRKYPEGWSSDPGRDNSLEFRLSIFHATKDDSGVFTCITPARQSHHITIVVEAVHCSPLPLRRGLISSSQSTKMSSEVMFSCANGNSLIGASQLTCLPSGNWSAPLPLCESVECGEIAVPGGSTGKLRVTIVSRGVGGRAAFSCVSGWGLRGPQETICMPNGEWSQPFPLCVEVSCPAPQAPNNGYLLGRAPFRAGDIVQFNCNPTHMMQGQPIVACQDNARWSGETPKCIQACSYPGTTIFGRMSSVKFFYKIGENISFTCEPGLQLRGAAMLRCLRSGKWSNAIPICSRDASGNYTLLISDEGDRLAMLSDDSWIYSNSTSKTMVESSATKAPIVISRNISRRGKNQLPLTDLQKKEKRNQSLYNKTANKAS